MNNPKSPVPLVQSYVVGEPIDQLWSFGHLAARDLVITALMRQICGNTTPGDGRALREPLVIFAPALTKYLHMLSTFDVLARIIDIPPVSIRINPADKVPATILTARVLSLPSGGVPVPRILPRPRLMDVAVPITSMTPAVPLRPFRTAGVNTRQSLPTHFRSGRRLFPSVTASVTNVTLP
jgi:hypothetical protein